VKVTLEIAGGFTGDLFALLTHDGKSSVLLNRPGRRSDNLLGYDDSGLHITLSDDASAGDIHTYRLPDHTLALGGSLNGTWQPDARTANPNEVLDTSARSAFLSEFAGQNAAGGWTLYLADLSPVGEAVLKSWSLEVSAIPEPREYATGARGGGASMWFLAPPLV
jgi:hypothetical protein